MLPVSVSKIPANNELVSGWITRYGDFGDPHSVRWDMHQAFEIEVVLSGRHERHLGDLVLTLDPGDISTSAAWEPHGWRALSTGTVVLVIFFVPEFLGDEMPGGVSWLSLFVAAPRDRPQSNSPALRQQILAIAGELRQEIEGEERGPAWLTAMRLGVLRLLFAVSRQWRPPETLGGKSSVRPSDLARIAPAVILVGSEPGERVTLDQGAAACLLSASRFSSIFRHAMGMSFGQFVLRSRLGRAAQLMRTSDTSIDAIARSMGFADASHFHHAFTKLYGVTPARYREQHSGS